MVKQMSQLRCQSSINTLLSLEDVEGTWDVPLPPQFFFNFMQFSENIERVTNCYPRFFRLPIWKILDPSIVVANTRSQRGTILISGGFRIFQRVR